MLDNILKMKMRGLKLFIIVFLICISFMKTTVHAAVPYTYTANTTVANTIDITFDYNISDVDATKITVYQASGNTTMRTPTMVIAGHENNVLRITIGDLDPDVVSYAIKIEKDALTYPDDPYVQLTDFILPFSSSDLASGFATTFMNNTPAAINNLNNIFMYNSMKDISIYVPKKYITSIETIQKNKGLSSTTTSYSLTNIDVKTDTSVKRLKVSIIGTTELLKEQELLPSSSLPGFTTGVAGINFDTVEPDYTLNVSAFDLNGKLLECSHYNKKMVDVTTDVISDYVAKTSTSSNKTLSLYDLMKTPATLTSLLQSYDIDNLNSVKVIYTNTGDTRVVSNSQGQINDAANVLAKALNDFEVRYIKFASALIINPIQDIKLARDRPDLGNIVLDGNGSTINGNVTIGNGDDNTYELRNITINGDLTINLSTNGDYSLNNNVVVKGKTIVLGKKISEVESVVSMDDKTSYIIGDTVKIGVKFNEAVFVGGNPTLKLISDTTGKTFTAVYDKTSTEALANKNIVIFKYFVVPGAGDFQLKTAGDSHDSPISLNSGFIQPRDGSSALLTSFSGSEDKLICTSTTNKNIAVDNLIPMVSVASELIQGDNITPQVITCKANDILDETSAEVAGNWIIKDNNIVYIPEAVSLNGDKRTVTLVMKIGERITDFTNIKVIMTEAVKDKAGNIGDSTPPSAPVILTSTATVNAASEVVTGTAEAGSTVTIIGGSSSVTAVATVGGTYSAIVNLTQNAINTLTATATDTTGNVSANSNTAAITEDSLTAAGTPTVAAYDRITGTLVLTTSGAEAGSTVNVSKVKLTSTGIPFTGSTGNFTLTTSTGTVTNATTITITLSATDRSELAKETTLANLGVTTLNGLVKDAILNVSNDGAAILNPAATVVVGE